MAGCENLVLFAVRLGELRALWGSERCGGGDGDGPGDFGYGVGDYGESGAGSGAL